MHFSSLSTISLFAIPCQLHLVKTELFHNILIQATLFKSVAGWIFSFAMFFKATHQIICESHIITIVVTILIYRRSNTPVQTPHKSFFKLQILRNISTSLDVTQPSTLRLRSGPSGCGPRANNKKRLLWTKKRPLSKAAFLLFNFTFLLIYHSPHTSPSP